MLRGFLTSVACACAAVCIVAAASAKSPYPLNLAVAVKQAYAPLSVLVNSTCKKTIQTNNYALVSVQIKPSGRASTIALQFISTAGWFAFWRDGKTLKGVPASQKPSVLKTAAQLQKLCA